MSEEAAAGDGVAAAFASAAEVVGLVGGEVAAGDGVGGTVGVSVTVGEAAAGAVDVTVLVGGGVLAGVGVLVDVLAGVGVSEGGGSDSDGRIDRVGFADGVGDCEVAGPGVEPERVGSVRDGLSSGRDRLPDKTGERDAAGGRVLLQEQRTSAAITAAPANPAVRGPFRALTRRLAVR